MIYEPLLKIAQPILISESPILLLAVSQQSNGERGMEAHGCWQTQTCEHRAVTLHLALLWPGPANAVWPPCMKHEQVFVQVIITHSFSSWILILSAVASNVWIPLNLIFTSGQQLLNFTYYMAPSLHEPMWYTKETMFHPGISEQREEQAYKALDHNAHESLQKYFQIISGFLKKKKIQMIYRGKKPQSRCFTEIQFSVGKQRCWLFFQHL